MSLVSEAGVPSLQVFREALALRSARGFVRYYLSRRLDRLAYEGLLLERGGSKTGVGFRIVTALT